MSDGLSALAIKCPSCGSVPGQLCYGNGSMRDAHLARELAARDAATAALKAEVARLTENAQATYCAYCSHRIPLDDAAGTAISAHIQTCARHPIRSVEAERDALRKELREQQERDRIYSEGIRNAIGDDNREKRPTGEPARADWMEIRQMRCDKAMLAALRKRIEEAPLVWIWMSPTQEKRPCVVDAPGSVPQMYRHEVRRVRLVPEPEATP